jgi:crotonobetainyl-CoA:carnitine CoA-transferase CaiB-like acyl-CoA transferase
MRVLEIASLSPTQLGMHLADLGAEVIKVEPPGQGDATRLMGTRPGFAESGLHRRWNRGKRSLALDTSRPEGLDLLKRLIPKVDVIIEGLRPGTLEKMGLGREVLASLKPNIVFISLSGYGQTGPYRNLPGHGIGFDAIAGLAGIEQDENGRLGVPAGHVYLGALMAPMLAASSVLAALSWCRRTGEPAFLDIAQSDVAAFANFSLEESLSEERAAQAGGLPPRPANEPDGGPHPRASTTQAYRTRDGKLLMIMALERKFFLRLAEVTGRPDLTAYAEGCGHVVPGSIEVDAALVEVIATRDRCDWMDLFAKADVPVVPINEGAQVIEDPQMRARLEWLPADQGAVTLKSPLHAEPEVARPCLAPAIGQDTAAILNELGVPETEIEALATAGIVRIGKVPS